MASAVRDELGPGGVGLPLSLELECRTSRRARRGRRHPVTVTADWTLESHHDLDAERLCRQFGVSRASLYRLFAPLGGVSEHIRNRRLRKVFDALSDPAQPLAMAQVAERYGFTVWSSFSRAFKGRFGMTPGEARGLGVAAAARANVLRAGTGALSDWLRALDAA